MRDDIKKELRRALVGQLIHRGLPYLAACLERRFVSSITVDEYSDAYLWLRYWLSTHAVNERLRALTLHAQHTPSSEGAAGVRSVFVPAPGRYSLLYKGTRVWVTRAVVEQAKWRRETITLRVYGRSTQLLRELCEEARRAYTGLSEGKVIIYHDAGHGWEPVAARDKRAPESVVLREGLWSHLIADVDAFLAGRDWYLRTGTPFRRGYLLYGPPGTGKSSIVMALASHYGMGVYAVDLTRAELTDDQLVQSLIRVPPRSIILLEDIDAAFAEREPAVPGISFKGLLNAIDGLASPEHTLLFMTTNHPERLEPALVRPGRADVHLLIGTADAYQARHLFLKYFPQETRLAEVFAERLPEGVTPARIQAHLLFHRDDPERAATSPVP